MGGGFRASLAAMGLGIFDPFCRNVTILMWNEHLSAISNLIISQANLFRLSSGKKESALWDKYF